MSELKKKKILLYYFSSTEFLSHKEHALQKIKETLDVFISSKDNISVIWYHDPFLDDYLCSEIPELFEEYLNLEKNFKNSGCGIYVNDSSLENSLVAECDAYYGSGGYLATCCADAKKPVMIHDISARFAQY